MTHIVIDAREMRTSTGRYIERLTHYLQDIDHAHDYTILLYPQDMDGWEPHNPRFTKVACPHKEFTFDEQLGMLRQVNGLKADLVHFGMTQQPVLYKNKAVTTVHDLTTIRFRNPTKNPVIFTVKQQVYKAVTRIVAHKSAAVIAPTEFVKKDLAGYAGIPADKIAVTYEAADPITAPLEPLPTLTGKQFIMYLGRPLPHKNLGRLIDAFILLKEKQPDLLLVLAGKKADLYERYQAEAAQKGMTTSIVFTGFVSEGQLRWLYENCSAYIFPSLSEGFGLPALEAMQHGAPVVSSNATCLPEVYGDAAHYFNPLDIRDMADRINDVLTDSKLRQRLIRKGKQQAARYSWKRMAEQTLAVYKKVLGEA